MRLSLRERQAGEIEFGILYGTIAVLALAAARALPVLDILPSCVFRSLTGVSCPTCGSTRSLVHLAQGDVGQALAMNPLFALAFVGALLFLLYNGAALFTGSRLALFLTSRESSFLRAGAAVLFLANWLYLIIVI